MQSQYFTKTVLLGVSTFAYDVHVGVGPGAPTGRKLYDGDIYVWKSPEGGQSGISIYSSSCWTPWTPSTITKLHVSGRRVYPAPCPEHGIQYVESTAEVLQAHHACPHDLEALSRLLINDINTTDMDVKVHTPTIRHRKQKESRDCVTCRPRGRPQQQNDVNVELNVSHTWYTCRTQKHLV